MRAGLIICLMMVVLAFLCFEDKEIVLRSQANLLGHDALQWDAILLKCLR